MQKQKFIKKFIKIYLKFINLLIINKKDTKKIFLYKNIFFNTKIFLNKKNFDIKKKLYQKKIFILDQNVVTVKRQNVDGNIINSKVTASIVEKNFAEIAINLT